MEIFLYVSCIHCMRAAGEEENGFNLWFGEWGVDGFDLFMIKAASAMFLVKNKLKIFLFSNLFLILQHSYEFLGPIDNISTVVYLCHYCYSRDMIAY